MSRALFFVAILIVVCYFVFWRSMKHSVPPPSNVEQKYMKQSGDESQPSSQAPTDQ